MAERKPIQNEDSVGARERQMVESAQQDPAKFSDLYEAYFHNVYAFVFCRVRNRHESEDLTSEVFQRALENLPKFKWRGVPFSAWLFRIAGNLMADRSRRTRREDAIDGVDPAEETHVQSNLEEVERKTELFRLVSDLPTDQKQVLVLRFAHGKSIREIATELARSEGAIKQLQFRGLQTLRAVTGKTDG